MSLDVSTLNGLRRPIPPPGRTGPPTSVPREDGTGGAAEVHTARGDTGYPPGFARLAVEQVRGRSVVHSALSVSPVRLLIPRARGSCVWGCLSSLGGGLVAGDATRLSLRLAPGARCFLGTQASTKIYRSTPGAIATHHTEATLEKDAVLVLAPDPVQAFAHSEFHQRQSFHLKSGAGLVLVDWLSAGRTACGERWAFRRYLSHNQVFIDGDCRWFDSLRLDAADGPLVGAQRMGPFNGLAMVALFGAPVLDRGRRWLERIQAEPVPRGATLVVTASPLREGAILRGAAHRLDDLIAWVHEILGSLRAIVDGEPWFRKGI